MYGAQTNCLLWALSFYCSLLEQKDGTLRWSFDSELLTEVLTHFVWSFDSSFDSFSLKFWLLSFDSFSLKFWLIFSEVLTRFVWSFDSFSLKFWLILSQVLTEVWLFWTFLIDRLSFSKAVKVYCVNVAVNCFCRVFHLTARSIRRLRFWFCSCSFLLFLQSPDKLCFIRHCSASVTWRTPTCPVTALLINCDWLSDMLVLTSRPVRCQTSCTGGSAGCWTAQGWPTHAASHSAPSQNSSCRGTTSWPPPSSLSPWRSSSAWTTALSGSPAPPTHRNTPCSLLHASYCFYVFFRDLSNEVSSQDDAG